jgi:hypothetical protein
MQIETPINKAKVKEKENQSRLDPHPASIQRHFPKHRQKVLEQISQSYNYPSGAKCHATSKADIYQRQIRRLGLLRHHPQIQPLQVMNTNGKHTVR